MTVRKLSVFGHLRNFLGIILGLVPSSSVQAVYAYQVHRCDSDMPYGHHRKAVPSASVGSMRTKFIGLPKGGQGRTKPAPLLNVGVPSSSQRWKSASRLIVNSSPGRPSRTKLGQPDSERQGDRESAKGRSGLGPNERNARI